MRQTERGNRADDKRSESCNGGSKKTRIFLKISRIIRQKRKYQNR